MNVRHLESLVVGPLRLLLVASAFAGLIVEPTIFVRARVPDGEKPPTPQPAVAAFEHFKKLEGKWRGRSTKGWEEVLTFKTIAGGSVVVGTS
ncbi:MAG: hypothetical protein WAU45_06570, partial [Blastocatellia bacterium]